MPISRQFGFDRGQSIDRFYIEKFLGQNADCIRGSTLEIGDDTYTRLFGGNRVTHSDVLHAVSGNEQATLVSDLASAHELVSDTYDCIICTQTLQHIYDVPKALAHLYRIIRPGGALLVSVPGISQISRYDMDRWGDFWRFTTLSISRLMAEQFPPESTRVEAHGNVLVAVAFLHGLSASEMRLSELITQDPDYQLVITVRADKPRQT